MKTEQIRRLINEGKQIERQQGLLRQGVIGLANLNGTSLTEQQVQDAIAFITEYIEHAPALIDMIEQSAAAAGQSSVVQPIVGAAEDYFLSPHDLIPDHFGLLGLVHGKPWHSRSGDFEVQLVPVGAAGLLRDRRRGVHPGRLRRDHGRVRRRGRGDRRGL